MHAAPYLYFLSSCFSTLRGCCGARAHAYEGRGAAWIPHGMRIPRTQMPGAHDRSKLAERRARPLVRKPENLYT